jgi:hypothetical protein
MDRPRSLAVAALAAGTLAIAACGSFLSTGAAPASFVADPVPACAQPPQSSAVLSVFPVRSGPALRGTIP